MADDVRPTALTDWHVEHGATMADFAGWRLPGSYDGTRQEHRAVRTDAGVFDVSHLGTVWISGEQAEQVVAGTFTNDPARLTDGTSQYTLCCNEQGGVVDDLIVYRLAASRFLAVPNAANTAAVVEQLVQAAADRGVQVEDASGGYAMLAVQGPRSPEAVVAALGIDLRDLQRGGIAQVGLAGTTGWVGRTGYTGEIGCELVVPAGAAVAVWEAVVAEDVTPAGLSARDTLRLEMGYPLHGNDLTVETDPYEARLAWAVKLRRGPFTGRDALAAIAERGPGRRLWGLLADGRRPPRAGMQVLADGDEVGVVTSGTTSPTLQVGIGLAYVDDPLGPGDDVEVDVRGRREPFAVVRPPFVDR